MFELNYTHLTADMSANVGKSRHVVSFWAPWPTRHFAMSPTWPLTCRDMSPTRHAVSPFGNKKRHGDIRHNWLRRQTNKQRTTNEQQQTRERWTINKRTMSDEPWTTKDERWTMNERRNDEWTTNDGQMNKQWTNDKRTSKWRTNNEWRINKNNNYYYY